MIPHLTDSSGHPIERFNPEIHTGWHAPDGRHIFKEGAVLPRVVASGKVDGEVRTIVKFDPEIHIVDRVELADDNHRMAVHRRKQP